MYGTELSFPVDHIKTNLSIWEERKREKPLVDIAQSTTTTVTDDHYGQVDDEDYHSQAVSALVKKDDSSFQLPKMPAVAMTSLSQNTNNNIYPHSKDSSNQQEYDHGEWDPQESSGPVYCQCTIQ